MGRLDHFWVVLGSFVMLSSMRVFMMSKRINALLPIIGCQTARNSPQCPTMSHLYTVIRSKNQSFRPPRIKLLCASPRISSNHQTHRPHPLHHRHRTPSHSAARRTRNLPSRRSRTERAPPTGRRRRTVVADPNGEGQMDRESRRANGAVFCQIFRIGCTPNPLESYVRQDLVCHTTAESN